MAKSNADTDSTGVCEKIYNAVAGNPAFRAIHRKSGRSQSPVVTNVTDSNQLTLQNADKPGITLVSVPLKETVAQQKAGPTHVNIQIHSEPPMVAKKEEVIAKPPVSTQKNGEVTIGPSKAAYSGHSTRKEDAAKSTTVFVHIEGREGNVAPKQQEIVKSTTVASGHGQLKKVASNNGSKLAFSSLQEGKMKQEKAVSPNIVVMQGRGQGIYVSPEAEPAKIIPHLPVQGAQANPKPAVLKTMSNKNDHFNRHGGSDHRESKKAEADQVPATDNYSEYISHVKNKMRSLSNIGDHNENAKAPATRSATRRDSFHDRVANYINRARNNIRTTSNVGDT